MCLKKKEAQIPPPPPKKKKTTREGLKRTRRDFCFFLFLYESTQIKIALKNKATEKGEAKNKNEWLIFKKNLKIAPLHPI